MQHRNITIKFLTSFSQLHLCSRKIYLLHKCNAAISSVRYVLVGRYTCYINATQQYHHKVLVGRYTSYINARQQYHHKLLVGRYTSYINATQQYHHKLLVGRYTSYINATWQYQSVM